jgi:hypothetical protein
MRKAARSLSLSIALATLLGACQSVPNGVGAPLRTQGQTPSAATASPAPETDAEANRRKSSPRKQAPTKPRQKPKPKPNKPSPVGKRPQPNPSRQAPHRPQPNLPVVPVRDGGYPRYRDYPDQWERRQSDVRITRVWTEDVGSDRLTIHWTTDRPTVGLVEWGTTDFTDRSDWQMTADTYHTVVIEDLVPDTEYRFRVMARAAGGTGIWSPELRARTAF